MTEVSDDLDDVSHFLFCTNDINEILSNENVLQPSDDHILNEESKSSVIDGLSQNQTFRLIDEDLSNDQGKTIINNTYTTLF